MTVFTEVPDGTFGVLDTGKKRSAADTLHVEGEKHTVQLAAMLRTIYLYDTRPELAWSGRAARLSNPQILELLEQHPTVRDYTTVADHIGQATGMIRTAAGAASYLVDRVNPRADLSQWYAGISEGTSLGKGIHGWRSATRCMSCPGKSWGSRYALGIPASMSRSIWRRSTRGRPATRSACCGITPPTASRKSPQCDRAQCSPTRRDGHTKAMGA
jgi:hypothetical protein